MSDGKILDLSEKLNAKKAHEGDTYICCRICGSEEAGFGVVGAFNHSGAYYIKYLLCLSEKCAGNTEIEITGGFVS